MRLSFGLKNPGNTRTFTVRRKFTRPDQSSFFAGMKHQRFFLPGRMAESQKSGSRTRHACRLRVQLTWSCRAPEEPCLRHGDGVRHGTPERVEEKAEQLRPQGLSVSLATGAEVSFDCSVSLLIQRRGRRGPLCDPWFCCARRLQCRSV